MIPLTKRATAQLLRALCRQRNQSPAIVLQEIRSSGVIVADYILRCVDGVYYLTHIPDNDGARYTILVDGVVYGTQSTRAGALVMADKLCQLLFTAREIVVMDGDDLIVKWRRLSQRVNQWVQRYI